MVKFLYSRIVVVILKRVNSLRRLNINFLLFGSIELNLYYGMFLLIKWKKIRNVKNILDNKL